MGVKSFHIHLPSSSGLFGWHRRRIAAGVLHLSSVLPLIRYSFLLSMSLQVFFPFLYSAGDV